MCIGSHLANRQLYTTFLRLILAFPIVAPADPANQPVLDPLLCKSVKTSLTTEPRPFKVGLKIRDQEKLCQWLENSNGV